MHFPHLFRDLTKLTNLFLIPQQRCIHIRMKLASQTPPESHHLINEISMGAKDSLLVKCYYQKKLYDSYLKIIDAAAVQMRVAAH